MGRNCSSKNKKQVRSVKKQQQIADIHKYLPSLNPERKRSLKKRIKSNRLGKVIKKIKIKNKNISGSSSKVSKKESVSNTVENNDMEMLPGTSSMNNVKEKHAKNSPTKSFAKLMNEVINKHGELLPFINEYATDDMSKKRKP